MMKPISYVDALNNHYGSMGFPPYQWTINDTAPLHRVSKPLAECRISMLTSGGVSHCTLPGFDPDARNDHRLDTVPGDVSTVDFNINDSYYNHDDADSDLNCIFPIDSCVSLRHRVKSAALRRDSGVVLWVEFITAQKLLKSLRLLLSRN